MEQFFQDWMRAQRRGNRGMSSKDMARLLALVGFIISGCFWYPVQWDFASPQTYGDMAIAIGFGTFLVLGPPVLSSFFVPWTPAARLLYRLNARTLGQIVAGACALYLLYYAGMISYTWWMSRPVVAQAGIAFMQMMVGLIATIATPALLWAPVSDEELEEIARQDQLVKKYELQTQSDIAYLQGMLLDAQKVAVHGLASIAAQDRPDVAWRMQWLLEEMDRNLGGIASTVGRTSGTMAAFPEFAQRDDVLSVLDYVKDVVQQIAERPSTHHEFQATQVVDVIPAQAVSAASERDPHVAPRHEQRDDPRSSVTIPDHENYVTARRALGVGAWMVKDLAEVLRCEEPTARKVKAQWQQAGLIVSAGMNGRFKFTESEA